MTRAVHHRDIHWSDPRLIRRFGLIFLSMSVLLVSLMYWLYWQQTAGYMDAVSEQEKLVVKLNTLTVLENMRMAVADLAYLRLQIDLPEYSDADNGVLQQLTNDYVALSETRRIYDQIRLLRVSGQEWVRVNYRQGKAVTVPRSQLQNKGSRYYVRDTLRLADGGVFVSPLDLNIEKGQIERPLKPVIRLGTPVFDQGGKLRGAVILNYLADKLLGRLRAISATASGDAMLVNDQGYWLLSPQAEDEWGFMLKEKGGIHFRAKFPGEWEVINKQSSGQMLTEQGLFTFTTLYPVKKISDNWDPGTPGITAYSTFNSSDGYQWKLLSVVSPQVLRRHSTTLISRLTKVGSFLLLTAAVGSYLIALAMSRRRLHLKQLETLAHFDSLTGLPNRTLYLDRLTEALKQAERYSRPLGQLYIDVDNFKDINDTLGHGAGDQLLTQIAERIRSTLRKSDTVARLGGDEFIVLLMLVTGRVGCEAVAGKIVNIMQEPFTLQGVSRHITVSIGITLYPEDGNTAGELLKNSDIALYKAKEKGKNLFQNYTGKMNDAVLARMTMEDSLREALAKDEFSLYYQPKVDLQSNKITGAEALIRWYLPEEGWIGPADFIPVAERSRLILTLGEWIIGQACRDIQTLSRQGFQDITIAVNVSSAQIHQQDVYGIIRKTLADSGLEAHQLEVEITETALLHDNNTSERVLSQLSDNGIKIWLDDFGTGYSSLSHLRRFSVSGVKIDRSFINDIDTDENDQKLVSAIIGLAQSLGIAVIAEGVETGQQLDSLKSSGCQFGQGYLFCRPVPFKEFTELLTERKALKWGRSGAG